jgi:NitT/TauT family transport system ATP-binding protein/nitrate/nitrite transport system substrate-binding protein
MTGSVFRIGVLRLTDAAPLIVARELGYFTGEDLDVALSVEPSWANIADKLAYGLLDGAMMLPPLALALQLGLSGSSGPEAIIIPAGLSLNGNTVDIG